MTFQKTNKKKIVAFTIIFILSLILGIAISRTNFKEQELTWNDICQYGAFYGCGLGDDCIVTYNNDPLVVFEFGEAKRVAFVDVYFGDMMPEMAEVWAVGEEWQVKSTKPKSGDNKFFFGKPFEKKYFVRVDFGSVPDVSVKVDKMVINKTSTINMLGIVIGLLIFAIINVIYQAYRHRVAGTETYLIERVHNKCGTLYGEIRKTNFVKLTLVSWIVFCVGILSVLKADFLYIDDLGRNFHGDVSDWDKYSRFFAEVVCKWVSGNKIVADLSPWNQIITMLLMAISFSIVVVMLFPEKSNTKWIYLAAVPFALSPYFLENISYKIECIVHGVTVLVSVMPFTFVNKKKYIYTLVTVICMILACITYQGGTGVFPVIVVVYAAVCVNNGKKIKEVLGFVMSSAVGYISGLAVFRLFLMKDVNTHVTSEMLSVRDMIPGVISNFLNYYRTVIVDFSTIWLILIGIVFGIFIFVFVCQSKIGAVKSGLLSIACLGMMLVLCNGIYIVLANCVFMPRTMYCFGIVISMAMIQIVGDRRIFANLCGVLLAWYFVTFSMSYGNCLISQKEYTNVIMQGALNYLNEHYDSQVSYVLDIDDNNIGFAPDIRNQISDSVILSKLVPSTLGGGWTWSEYKLYGYYNLADNFTVVYPSERGNGKPNLLEANLPMVDETMWFYVYSDGTNILLSFKN